MWVGNVYRCIYKYSVRLKIKICSILFGFKNVYPLWISKFETYDEIEVEETIRTFKYMPLFSILLPVYNTPKEYLVECIESVRKQKYPNWELCIVDDSSNQTEVKEILTHYQTIDPRIKCIFLTENRHISAASNKALELASGDYIALLDHDDVLSHYALYEVAKYINDVPDIDVIYTDEDNLEDDVRKNPHFKPSWNYRKLLSINYICHLIVLRASIVRDLKGFREGYEGAQDWDLLLRVSEVTTKFHHVRKILYHWRIHDNSTAKNEKVKSYVKLAQKKAVSDAISRKENDQGSISI